MSLPLLEGTIKATAIARNEPISDEKLASIRGIFKRTLANHNLIIEEDIIEELHKYTINIQDEYTVQTKYNTEKNFTEAIFMAVAILGALEEPEDSVPYIGSMRIVDELVAEFPDVFMECGQQAFNGILLSILIREITDRLPV